MTDDQKKIIECKDSGSFIVLAPAGCGKTEVLTNNVKEELKNKRNVLCVTFTETAAREMLSRVKPSVGSFIKIGTIHSICRYIVDLQENMPERDDEGRDDYFEEWDLGKSSRILGQSDSERMLNISLLWALYPRKAKHLENTKYAEHPLLARNGNKYNLNKLEKDFRNAVNGVSHTILQKQLKTPENLLLFPKYNVDVQYEDTDEIGAGGTETGSSGAKETIYAIPKPYWKIIKKAAKIYNDNKAKQNAKDFDDLLCYGWKYLNDDHHGKIRRYNSVHVDEAQDLNPLQLEIIRRLTVKDEKDKRVFYYADPNQAIFSFLYDAAGSREHFSSINDIKSEVTGSFEEHIFTLKDNFRSTPKVLQYQQHFLKKFFSTNWGIPEVKKQCQKSTLKEIEKNPVEIHKFPNHKSEKEGVISIAIDLLKNIEDDGKYKVAILCRRNSDCRDFEKQMRSKSNIKRLTEVPIVNLSDETLATLPKTSSIFKKIREDYKEKYPDGLDIFDILDSATKKNLKEDEIVLIMRKYLKKMLDAASLSEKAIKNMASDEIRKYLGKLANSKMSDILMSDSVFSKCVVLSTVHKAKGLSFDAVIVPSVYEGEYPYKSSTTKEAIAEDARIFYVAISRAISKLVITYPVKASYKILTRPEKGKPSKEQEEELKKNNKERKRVYCTSTKHGHAKIAPYYVYRTESGRVKPSRFIMHPRGTNVEEHNTPNQLVPKNK